MSVLKGEGRFPILFGTTSISGRTRVHSGYLARPDLSGEWPTVVLVPGRRGVSSSVKDLARRLARHGLAVIAPDLYRARGPDRGVGDEAAGEAFDAIPAGRARADLEDVAAFITNPAGFWSNAESGFGVLALGRAARLAVPLVADGFGAALALVHPALADQPAVDEEPAPGPGPGRLLAGVAIPVIGLSGRDDDTVPVDDVHAAREQAPHAEWVLYEGVGRDYLDDSGPTYDRTAAADTLDRLTEFFEKHLPPRSS